VGVFSSGEAQVRVVPRAKFEPAGDKVYHGASLPDTWEENGLRRQIQSYNAAAGKKISVVTWFASAYENGRRTTWSQNYASSLARVKRVGALSLIKFSTQDYAYASTRRAAELKQISLGAWDEYFKDAAQTVRGFGSPVFISINHEMNGTWYPYSQAYPGSRTTAADFVAAWRRIVKVFRDNGASNAAFVWSPNVPDIGGVPFASYYPGDDVVDWVGVSFYSGNTPDGLDTIYNAYSMKKPFFITEWATGPDQSRHNRAFPGDAAWIKQFFSALNTRYPRVKAISWFNWDKEKDGESNYTLARLPDQSRVYAQDIAAPRYLDQPIILGGSNTVEVARFDAPAPEIRLREIVPIERGRVETARVESAPLQTPRRERLRLQVVPTVR
jgi:beta-mannanase